MLTTTKAIVLRSVRYGERRKIVSMFCRDYGLLSFACSQGRGRHRADKSNLYQPLSVLEIEFDKKPLSEIHTIRDVRLDYAASTIPFDPYKLSISLFLAEFLRHSLAGEQRNEPLFDYMEHSIEWLDAARKDFSNFHLIFMVKVSQFIGFFPNLDSYEDGSWFDLKGGTFSTLAPSHSDAVRPQESSLIPLLARLNYQTMHLLRLSRLQRNECVESILKFYRLHLPSFPEMRSFDVLRELFA